MMKGAKQALIFSILLVAIVPVVLAVTQINTCQTLSVADTYLLNTSVSSAGTCMTISANNVILNCQGNTITYSTDGGTFEHGVLTSGTASNLEIRNCILRANVSNTGGQRHSIWFPVGSGAANGLITNNTLITGSSNSANNAGIRVDVGAHNITNNTIRTNRLDSNSQQCC
jgi:hypothetical protein